MSQKRVAILALAAGLVAGGGAGAILGMTRLASADTSTTTPANSSSSETPAARATGSNEDATHEAGESAAREAEEDAGKAGFGHHRGGSNEDAAHEAGESATREAAEDAGQPAATPSAPAAAASNA